MLFLPGFTPRLGALAPHTLFQRKVTQCTTERCQQATKGQLLSCAVNRDRRTEVEVSVGVSHRAIQQHQHNFWPGLVRSYSCRFPTIPVFNWYRFASFCSEEANKPANLKQPYVPAATINSFPGLPDLARTERQIYKQTDTKISK